MAAQNDAAPATGIETQAVPGVQLLGDVGDLGLAGIRSSTDYRYREGVGRAEKIGLYKKLRAILAAVERIEKDKHNQQGNYQYASEKAIKEVFHPLFMEHGLILVPVGQDMVQFTPPSGDKKSYITTIKCTFAIVDLETGAELRMEQIASGGDSLDKGTFKAITGAIKYVLTTLFLIPTGDDPEGDNGPKQRQAPQARAAAPRSQQDPESPISEAQVKRLFAVAKSKELPIEQMKAIVAAAGYTSSKDIKVRDYDSIVARIEESS